MALLHRAFAGRSSHLLLLVGDPKQAIYRFRGGDLNTYKQARRSVDRIDALIENFRTTPALMEGMNALMGVGLVRSDLPVPAVTPKGATTEHPLPPGHHPLQLLLIPSSAPTTKTALEQQLPAVIAGDVLRRLHQQPELSPADIRTCEPSCAGHSPAQCPGERILPPGQPGRCAGKRSRRGAATANGCPGQS